MHVALSMPFSGDWGAEMFCVHREVLLWGLWHENPVFGRLNEDKPEKCLGFHTVVLAWDSRSGLPEAWGQHADRLLTSEWLSDCSPPGSSLADWPPPCWSLPAQAVCQQLTWPCGCYQICLPLALLNSKTPLPDPCLEIFLHRTVLS